MVYTIKSKQDLEEFIEILEEEGIPLVYQDKKMIKYHAKNEVELDIFTNILSFYVSYINFREQLYNSFVKKGIDKEEAELMVGDALSNLSNPHYFYTMTRVLVKEYFKKMQTLNIESFSLFNMKGFKEEVKLYAEGILTSKNEGLYAQEGDLAPNEEQEVEIGVQDLFFSLRERAKANGLVMEDYKELHVFQQKNSLHFENKKGEKLDNEFFLNYLGSELEFDVQDEVDNPELFEGMMISSVLINIFEINKVVIHQTVTEKARDILLYNISSLKKETGKRVKVVVCDGCSRCQ